MVAVLKLGWRNILFWGAIFLLFIGAIFLLSDIIMPFFAGIILAYLFNPAKKYLIKLKLGKGLAALIIMVFFICFIVTFIFLMIPIFIEQFQVLSTKIPAYLATVTGEGKFFFEAIKQNFSGFENSSVYSFINRVFQNLFSVLNILSLIFITPIVTFYLLRDWETMINKIDSWLPERTAPIIRRQFHEIDLMLALYIRGKVIICLCLAIFYGAGLALIGLDYGLSIGIIAGFLSLIPYFGLIFGILVSLGLAFIQFGDGLPIYLTAGLFLIGQLCEDYWLIPRLIGGKTGLHALWIIFALMAGASLFGFLGILLAIPVAVIIRVWGQYAMKAYHSSMYYKGYRLETEL